jgi:hypothetical protein
LVAKKLSVHLKRKYSPMIDDRDGTNCFYCDKAFPTKKIKNILFPIDKNLSKEFDHLNNDRTDNRFENLVHAHRICNRQKSKNNDWIYKAKAKLRDNEKSADFPIAHAGTDKVTSSETDSNSVYCEVILKTLGQHLHPIGNLPARNQFVFRKEFLDLVAGKAYKLTGHASQITMGRILDMFCTSEYSYIKQKDESRKWIVRLRKEEEY